MSFLTELTSQLKNMWQRWSSGQRVSIVAAIALSIVSMAAVGYWAMTPQYIVLADHLTPGQTAEYVSALESAGISYKLNFAGSSLSVPQSQVNQARMELREFIGSEDAEDVEVSGSLWSDPAMNQARLSRQQELRLARTIEQMKNVRAATVHITPAESSPFVRDQRPAKASVTLDLNPGMPFSGRDSAAVVSLVAHSVENLSPENITVLSTDGRMLSFSNGLDGNVSGQLEYRTLLESNLAAKAENLLVPLLGLGNATVRVSAEIDFTETERTQRIIDADGKAKVREELRTESFAGTDSSPFGPPGTASNVTVPAPGNAQRNGQHESENITTEYVNGETTDLIKEKPGRITRLTVAAVVQLPQGASTEANTTLAGTTMVAPEAATGGPERVSKSDVEAIIRNAVGFDATRGDEIQVVTAQLAASPVLIPPIGFVENLEKYLPLLRALSLGGASIVALVLGTMIIKRLRPVVVETSTQESLSPEIVERLNELSLKMKEDPEVVTTVLASWLSPPETNESRVRKAA